jgi:hypothetical protein
MNPQVQAQMSGPITTENSQKEGRLKVDVGGSSKKKILKKILNNKMKM